MVRRHAASRFVPDAYVFPGGRIDDVDCSAEADGWCSGLDREEARRRIPDIAPEKALGAWIAGIRETFEEVGVLFARDRAGRPLSIGSGDEARFETHRRELHADRLSLGEIIDREGLRLAGDELHYFAHWITPVTSPIRYDVRFFVARAPEGQVPHHDGVELTEHRWVSPGEALADYERGGFPIILPTWAMLRDLAAFPTADEAIRSTRSKAVPAVLSVMVMRDGKWVEVMPDEVGDPT